MLYLAFIWHMHQPYYRDLITNEIHLPWVRLHGIKDYSDMVKILENFPKIHQTFNLVPSLIEQIQAYIDGAQDTFQVLSYKRAKDLNQEEKRFIYDRFFSAHLANIISVYPRYYQLYFKKQKNIAFDTQDYLDLQVWFNLAWFDTYFKKNIPELRNLIYKARYFTEEDKKVVLDTQIKVLKDILPIYREFQDKGQIEVTISPYYHPITPLLYDTKTAKEANKSTPLPVEKFHYPEDAKSQINQAVKLYQDVFGKMPSGMWPSEESVSEHIIPFIIQSGIKWIVTDEAILFKSLNKKRTPERLYKPYLLKREDGELNVVFRDRNLSDLIGFVYFNWTEVAASSDFMGHLNNIAKHSKGKDTFVVIAMDGENAWEYYRNDGWNFLSELYKSISESPNIKTVTLSEYFAINKPKDNIKRIACGSWIYGNFNKWIGQEQKNKAWEYLGRARKELEEVSANTKKPKNENIEKAWKQMYICEGSDWFWWYGDNNADFDYLYRRHLSNLYKLIGRDIPSYLNKPI